MAAASTPTDGRALIAVDLGAESCRVSLLRWQHGEPRITLVHRFANAPKTVGGELHWDLEGIVSGVDQGLRLCAAIAVEGIRSIAVDGWAVDYVRLSPEGLPLGDPFCYRDLRTVAAETSVHEHISPARLREITAITPMRINTLYQLYADGMAHLPAGRGWLNLPEYCLFRLGGRPVAEFTNAGHTQMLNAQNRVWSPEIFDAAGLSLDGAPELVLAGTDLGELRGPLSGFTALRGTRLIAPACHDTASAIAGIPAHGDDWAYISSGTWSLVGTLVPAPVNTAAAAADGFTNLAAAGEDTCFHMNVNGMWLISQCLEQWREQGHGHPDTPWAIESVVQAAENLPAPAVLLNVDDPELLLPGKMLGRINVQLKAVGAAVIPENPAHAPIFASLIFHSLAARYKVVLEKVAAHTGKKLKRLFIVGGGSRNLFLNSLIAEATGLELHRGSPESSTLGNFAIQLAALEAGRRPTSEEISGAAERLQGAAIVPA